MPEAQQTPQTELPLTPPPAAPFQKPTGRFEIPVFITEKKAEAPKAPEPKEAEVAAPEVATDQKTGDQETPAEQEVKPAEVTPDPAAKRETRRFERRIDKAYKQRAEAEARAKQLEERLAALEKPKAPEDEPKLEQFDYDPEKYAQAKADYAKTQVAKELEAKQKTESERAHIKRLADSWEEKSERGSDKYADWNEIVGELQPTSHLVAAIMEADNGDDIAYHLGKNPKEAQRISALPPLSQVREIGKLEAKLLSKPVEPKVPSKAPAPINPLSGNASLASNSLEDKNDYKEWLKVRNKQLGRTR